jgi:hypothetical protein
MKNKSAKNKGKAKRKSIKPLKKSPATRQPGKPAAKRNAIDDILHPNEINELDEALMVPVAEEDLEEDTGDKLL